MKQSFIVVLLFSSVLLTVYLMRKNQIEQKPSIHEHPPTLEVDSQSIKQPSTINLSLHERVLIEEIEDYIDSLSNNHITALNTNMSPIFFDSTSSQFAYKVQTNEAGVPVFATKKKMSRTGKTIVHTNYALKNGKTVRVENLIDPASDDLSKWMQYDYYQEKGLDTLTLRSSMKYIGTKKLRIQVQENTTKVDTMTQYLKFWGKDGLKYPEEDMNEIINASFRRGDFACQVDSIMDSPTSLRINTFDGRYFADFEIIQLDTNLMDIKETWPDFKGDIIHVIFKIDYDKATQQDKNYYLGSEVY